MKVPLVKSFIKDELSLAFVFRLDVCLLLNLSVWLRLVIFYLASVHLSVILMLRMRNAASDEA